MIVGRCQSVANVERVARRAERDFESREKAIRKVEDKSKGRLEDEVDQVQKRIGEGGVSDPGGSYIPYPKANWTTHSTSQRRQAGAVQGEETRAREIICRPGKRNRAKATV
jgi:hypothetical protein